MHEHSVVRMVGYVMGYFAENGKPVPPWSLVLNFNHSHRTLPLRPEHFTPDGNNVTPTLIREVEEIDPGWHVKSGEPVFEEAATKKRLKISDHIPGHIDIQAMLDSIDKRREPTFYSVMDEVFGKD
ncbi:hypothetical protein GCM10027399_26630 [Curvibacter fontanus]